MEKWCTKCCTTIFVFFSTSKTPTRAPTSRPVDFDAPLIRMTIPAALLLGDFVDTGPNREVLAKTISEVASSGLKTGQRVEEVEIVNVDGMSERTAGAALAKKPTKLEKMNGRGGNAGTSMLQLSAQESAVDHGSGDGLDKKRKQPAETPSSIG